MPGDVSAAPPSALEVVSFLGKTFGAGAALTAAVYVLRKVCLIMAWKSGGASHAELVNNLRSKSKCTLKRQRLLFCTYASLKKRAGRVSTEALASFWWWLLTKRYPRSLFTSLLLKHVWDNHLHVVAE